MDEYMNGWSNRWMGEWINEWITGSQGRLLLPCLPLLLPSLSHTPRIKKKKTQRERLRSWWRLHPTDKRQKPLALKRVLYSGSISEKVDLTSRILSGPRQKLYILKHLVQTSIDSSEPGLWLFAWVGSLHANFTNMIGRRKKKNP